MTIAETPCQFGPASSLMGVLTQPAPGGPVPATAIILFNAGVIPRFGPRRMNVKLARAMAEVGHTVLRFDLSGLGDSPHQGGEGDFRAQSARDIGAAMDHLSQALGIRRFVLIGVCSGAIHAFWATQADPRVAALMMIDGFWYPSRWSKWVTRWKRLRAKSWRERLGAWRRLAPRESPSKPQAGVFGGEVSQSRPSEAEFSRHMQTLVNRGVAVFFLFTGSVIDYISYENQLKHVFSGQSWVNRVRFLMREDMDHTATSQKSQRGLIELVLGWLPEATRAGGSAKP